MLESVGADILTDARIQVANESRSWSHRLKTKVWYTGRKTLRHLPGTIIGSAGSPVPIPVLGSVLNAALGAAVDKVHAQSLEAKKRKYRSVLADWPEEKEALRKLAKFEAKDLKAVAEKIDGNQPKLKDAGSSVTQALQAYNTSPTNDTAWNVAIALCEQERYINKLALLVQWAKAALKAIEDYLDKAREETLERQAGLVEALDKLYADAAGAAGPAKPGAPPPLPPRPGKPVPPPLPPRPGTR
jgi:hypothetical protein